MRLDHAADGAERTEAVLVDLDGAPDARAKGLDAFTQMGRFAPMQHRQQRGQPRQVIDIGEGISKLAVGRVRVADLEWVEARLARNPQWINEEVRRIAQEGDLFA